MHSIMIVTYKTCFHCDDKYYTTGGTPDEFNALASAFELHIVTAIHEKEEIKPEWKELDNSITFHPISPIKQLATYPPPTTAMKEATEKSIQVLTQNKIDLILLKGPSEISLAPIGKLSAIGLPLVYHYSLDWLDDVLVSSQKSFLRRLLKPYFKFAYKYRENLLKEMLPKVDLVATVSTPYLEKLKQFNPQKLSILQTTFTTTLSDLNETPTPHSKRKNFLYVGRIDANKNLPLIIKAMTHLKNKNGTLNFGLDIVGVGEALPEIEDLVKNEQLESAINFHSYRQTHELRQFYEKALATILPSFSETLGKVLIESLSAGTPILASKVGGIVDILKESENGHFISTTDPIDLASKMTTYYNDSESYTNLVQNSVSSVRGFTREETIQKWKDLFDSVINSNRLP